MDTPLHKDSIPILRDSSNSTYGLSLALRYAQHAVAIAAERNNLKNGPMRPGHVPLRAEAAIETMVTVVDLAYNNPGI